MKTLLFSCILLPLLFLTGCIQHRYVYTASKLNTPVLQHKGDSRLNASFSFGNAHGFGDSSTNLGYDVQAAYAITDHFALMASKYYRREADLLTTAELFSRPIYTLSYVKYRRSLSEVGAGYFTTVGRGVVFGIYGGTAFGDFSFTDVSRHDSTFSSNTFKADVSKYFIQPGVSIVSKKDVNVDLCLRVATMRYHTTNTTFSDFDLSYFNLNDAAHPKTNLYFEPSFCFQIPLPSVNWLRAEVSGSSVFNNSSGPVRFWNLSVGVTADPVKAFRKQ